VSWSIRAATVDDIPDLVRLRRVMFEAMGHSDADALDRMCAASAAYFARDLPTDAFRAWVAVSSGTDSVSAGDETGSGETGTCRWRAIRPGEPGESGPVASIGLVVHDVPPSPGRTAGREAYIMNLVTLPTHRRRGIAGALLHHVLDVVRAEGIPVASLHATGAGRGIYARAGFALDPDLPELRLSL